MTDHPNDPMLRDGLRNLPARGAGDGFTRRVLARLDEVEARQGGHRAVEPGGPGGSAWLPRVLATATVLVVLATAALLLPRLAGPATGVADPAVATGTLAEPALSHGGAAEADPEGASEDATNPATVSQSVSAEAVASGMDARSDSSRAAAADSAPLSRSGERLAAVDLEAPQGPLQDPPATSDREGADGEGGKAPSTETMPKEDSEETGPGSAARARALPARPDRRRPVAPPAADRQARVARNEAAGTGLHGEEGGLGAAANPAAPFAGSAAAIAPRQAVTPREAAVRRLAELQQRQRDLRGELAALAEVTREGRPPSLLLAGDESVELVLDLDRAADAGAGLGGTRPAGHRPGASGGLL